MEKISQLIKRSNSKEIKHHSGWENFKQYIYQDCLTENKLEMLADLKIFPITKDIDKFIDIDYPFEKLTNFEEIGIWRYDNETIKKIIKSRYSKLNIPMILKYSNLELVKFIETLGPINIEIDHIHNLEATKYMYSKDATILATCFETYDKQILDWLDIVYKN